MTGANYTVSRSKYSLTKHKNPEYISTSNRIKLIRNCWNLSTAKVRLAVSEGRTFLCWSCDVTSREGGRWNEGEKQENLPHLQVNNLIYSHGEFVKLFMELCEITDVLNLIFDAVLS